MRKITFLVGTGVGFIVGSKMGTGPYEQLESKVRKVAKRPDVQHTLHEVKSTAKDQVGVAAHKVAEKLPHSDNAGDGEVIPPPPIGDAETISDPV